MLELKIRHPAGSTSGSTFVQRLRERLYKRPSC